jgi:hypothetical protein
MAVVPTHAVPPGLLTDFQKLRATLFTERAARAQAERAAVELEHEVARLQVELRTFTVLRDNFHELYREERDRRIAVERVAADCANQRTQHEQQVRALRAESMQLRSALARGGTGPEVELRGAAPSAWTPRLVEGR